MAAPFDFAEGIKQAELFWTQPAFQKGREELLAQFDRTLAEVHAVLATLPAERLLDRTNPQPTGQVGEVSVLDAIYQVVGHVQQHVGQIIVLTKQMTATDLDLTMPRPR